MAEKIQFYGTGKRKTSRARVFLMLGSGQIVVNHVDFQDYFRNKTQRVVATQPLDLTANRDKFDIYVNVGGGGYAGQAGAVRHGIARALLEFDPELRPSLKKAGFLTRDPRQKERKKYGQPGARKRYQFSKR
ncbi:MAG TPA: 30S ribosomal protein S9 [Acidobacteriota bacterium]|nr:30S ribosomal protein S9 [Acidobacteriota bacterium]